MTVNLDTKWKLNNGLKIPCIGFGTWTLSGSKAKKAVIWALEEGYRLIDTATIYGNEHQIGNAIRESSVEREDIFLTTKVWQTDFGYENTLNAFESSLRKLQTNYVDLYLIHWPRSGRYETWKALTKLYEEGKAKSIGVSNYTVEHLEELLEKTSIIPMVNQIEFSPFLYQKDLLEYSRKKAIQLEAYSPLTRTEKFENPILQEIAKKYEKSPAQILIRWNIEHKVIPIPKSSSRKHFLENANVFDFKLEKEELKKLDSLNQDFRVVDDPIFN